MRSTPNLDRVTAMLDADRRRAERDRARATGPVITMHGIVGAVNGVACHSEHGVFSGRVIVSAASTSTSSCPGTASPSTSNTIPRSTWATSSTSSRAPTTGSGLSSTPRSPTTVPLYFSGLWEMRGAGTERTYVAESVGG